MIKRIRNSPGRLRVAPPSCAVTPDYAATGTAKKSGAQPYDSIEKFMSPGSYCFLRETK
jgi:hypothetical protein